MSYGTTLTLGNTGAAATEYLTRYFSLTDRLYDEQDQLLLNRPEALETLRLLLDARPCVQPSYSNWWRETAKAFAAGDTAMTVLFSNYASEITGLSTKIASYWHDICARGESADGWRIDRRVPIQSE